MITIGDFYGEGGYNTLFQNFDEIDQLGGYELFDDYCREFYSMQGSSACKTPEDLHRKFSIAWRANLYFIKTLWETMHYDYDPISNYDRYDRSYTSNKTADQKVSVDAASDSHEIGGNVINGVGDVQKHRESTYDSTSLRDVSDDEIQENTRTNTDSYGARNTTTAYQTEVTQPNVVQDKGEVTGDVVTISENKTTGNIGVMSTQDMIQQQRKVADFEYYKIVIERLINVVCDGVI